MKPGPSPVAPEIRFMRHVQKREDGCWYWTGTKGKGGYGNFRARPTDSRLIGAHRFAYESFVGPVPDGLFVLHNCDNASCVNPQHLRAGTHADNMADRSRRDRNARGDKHGSKTHPENVLRGDSHPMAKLTTEQAARIKLSAASGVLLARQFGVTPTTISRIRRGKSWAGSAIN